MASAFVPLVVLPDPGPSAPQAGPAIRARILDLVRQQPGLTVSKLRAQAGLGWGALYHHLARLQEDGALRSVTAGRRRILVLPGQDDSEALHRARALLLQPTLRCLAHAIVHGAGADVRTLARACRAGERTVYHHLGRLLSHGLIESGSPRRHVNLRATPLLLLLLERDGGTP